MTKGDEAINRRTVLVTGSSVFSLAGCIGGGDSDQNVTTSPATEVTPTVPGCEGSGTLTDELESEAKVDQASGFEFGSSNEIGQITGNDQSAGATTSQGSRITYTVDGYVEKISLEVYSQESLEREDDYDLIGVSAFNAGDNEKVISLDIQESEANRGYIRHAISGSPQDKIYRNVGIELVTVDVLVTKVGIQYGC